MNTIDGFFLYNEQHEAGINNEITYMNFPSLFAWKKRLDSGA